MHTIEALSQLLNSDRGVTKMFLIYRERWGVNTPQKGGTIVKSLTRFTREKLVVECLGMLQNGVFIIAEHHLIAVGIINIKTANSVLNTVIFF